MTTDTNQSEPKTFITIAEAAATIGCTRRFIETRITAGEIATFRPSTRMVRIRRSELERWIARYSCSSQTSS